MKKSKGRLTVTVILALLTAISIILGKYLAIRGGDIMRFSLENMPVIFAGIAFGPAAGLAVGVCADLLGCLLVGYTVNPLVTVGAAVIGIISGFAPRLLKRIGIKDAFTLIITVLIAHLFGSVIIKTAGLAAYYDVPFHILMLYRILNYIIVGALDGTTLHILLNNKEIKQQIERLKGEQNDLR